MAACGAAVEAAHWAKKNNLKVTLVDKAAMDRSGAVAMGLSAINQYVGLKDGENTVKDYVDYVRNDLMGVTREDLVANIARHVDSSVHLFEKWGLPIWKDEKGGYVHEGRWQLMINGESYKVIVAEAAKNALGADNIYERVFIVGPLMDGDRCVGAVRLLRPREQVLRVQGQGHDGAPWAAPSTCSSRAPPVRAGPRLVSAVQLRRLGLLHPRRPAPR